MSGSAAKNAAYLIGLALINVPGTIMFDQPFIGEHADNPPGGSGSNMGTILLSADSIAKAFSQPYHKTFWPNGPPHSSCLFQAQDAAQLLT